jgi:hypothetical protein
MTPKVVSEDPDPAPGTVVLRPEGESFGWKAIVATPRGTVTVVRSSLTTAYEAAIELHKGDEPPAPKTVWRRSHRIAPGNTD